MASTWNDAVRVISKRSRKKTRGLTCALIAVVVVLTGANALHAQSTSPWSDILWNDSTYAQPRVLIGNEWFELLAFDSLPVPEIITFAKSAYGRDWERRFTEDMLPLLRLMGHQPGGTVSLELRIARTGEALTRASVPMTPSNRQAIVRARRERQGVSLGAAAATVASSRVPRLTASEISRDLDAFQAQIEARWSYLRANGVDYQAAIARVRDRAVDGMDLDDYGRQLHLVISRFIDGHARVNRALFPSGTMPFLVEPSDGRYVAIKADRTGFVDPDYPYVSGIGGRPLSDFFAAVAPYVVRGSPQLIEKESVEMIQESWVMTQLLGIPMGDSVRLELRSVDGNRTRQAAVGRSANRLPPGAWPATRSRVIEGEIGYLRLPSMDEYAVNEVRTWMPRFQQTRGLVVDVRGNGGGSREALRTLFPYLMSESDAPRVVNAAKYRLHAEHSAAEMGVERYMYLESSSDWTPEERAAIARFRETFRPQWTPPAEQFSDWFYLVMSRRMNPAAYHYDRPVIVLLDPHSFSATDIFVSALEGWRNVTLVGTPSGGGSALQKTVQLPVSGLSLQLASMASFQASGRLFDGNGTQPDVLVHPTPESYLIGGRDNVLERAIELLGGRRER